jgi:hypothetical protein
MNIFNKIKKHCLQGTLLVVLGNILFSWLPKKKEIEAPAKFLSRVTDSKEDAIEFLISRIAELNKNGKISLLIAGEDVISLKLIDELNKKSINFERIDLKAVSGLTLDDQDKTGCIFTSFLDAGRIHNIGRQLLENKSTSNIPFEYVCIPRGEYSALETYDNYNSFSFVSPLLISELNYNTIYDQSLDIFGLKTPYFQYTAKCDVRDYMDLSQLILNVVKNNIDGDIAEFGSYKGHSGFLISEILKQLGSEKKLYMFDTFEEFPKEDIGIDAFWSNTHKVEFDEVKSRLAFQDNVTLVKGDFTITFKDQNLEKLSFIYVDCDSYRATKFLIEELFEQVLVRGGYMVFEDYGHPALLGNRLAIHQYFDNKRNCFKFFSHFSGYYIVVKL